MFTAFAMSLITVAAFFITACRVVPLRKLLAWGALLDVAFTVCAALLFYGTLTGLLIAVLSGLTMAITITILRALVGYDRLTFYRHGLRIYWTTETITPKWRKQ